MRITPTPEQMSYLASIGVTTGAIVPPPESSVPAVAVDDNAAVVCHASTGTNPLWPILLVVLPVIIVVLLLLIFGCLAHGHEPPSTADGFVEPVSPVEREVDSAERLDAMSSEITRLQEALGDAPTRDEVVDHQRQTKLEITKLHEALAATPARVELVDQQRRIDDVDQRLASLRNGLRNEISRNRLRVTEDDFKQAVLWSVLAAILAFITIRSACFARRIRQVEQIAALRLNESVGVLGDHPNAALQPAKSVVAPLLPSEITATRARAPALPTPVEQMRQIISSTVQISCIRVKPVLPSGPWELALASIQGNVRSENQDYGLCFKVDGQDVLIVADGCGGMAYGQKAAYLAAVSAAVSVVRAIGTASRWYSHSAKEIAANAIWDAAKRLAIEGDKLNIANVRDGLRTTLIVIIGGKHEFGYAYIGDGGAYVVRASGKLDRFLDPQKAAGCAMNVLAASLGPTVEGEPITGSLKRNPGDLLIVGTDGVFDRVDADFPKDVLRGCIQYKGDLQKAAEHVVQELAASQDAAGFICDDNLTLGIMGDMTIPKLSPGFWLPKRKTDATPVVPSMEAAILFKEGSP